MEEEKGKTTEELKLEIELEKLRLEKLRLEIELEKLKHEEYWKSVLTVKSVVKDFDKSSYLN